MLFTENFEHQVEELEQKMAKIARGQDPYASSEGKLRKRPHFSNRTSPRRLLENQLSVLVSKHDFKTGAFHFGITVWSLIENEDWALVILESKFCLSRSLVSFGFSALLRAESNCPNFIDRKILAT